MIAVTDFRSQIADVVNRVRYQKETIFLTKGKSIVAKIVPTESSYPLEKELKEAKIMGLHLGKDLVQAFLQFLRFLAECAKILVKKGNEQGKVFAKQFKSGFFKWVKLAGEIEG